MFMIRFTTGLETDADGWPHALGEIVFPDDSDGFAADLQVWGLSDYERQWQEGLLRLTRGAPSSVLVSSYVAPGDVAFYWPMWREGDLVIFQNHLLLPERTAGMLEVDWYDLVGPVRPRTSGSEGPVSEWIVPLRQLEAFFARG